MSSFPRDGGFSDAEEAFERLLPFLPWAIGLLLVLYLMSGAFYTVQPNEEAVLFRFGKYQETTGPGLHFKMPLADQVIITNIAENSLRLPYGIGDRQADTGESPEVRQVANESEEATLMLTGDLNIASVEWTMQWQITDPKSYVVQLPQSEDDRFAEKLITDIALTVMNRLVGDYSFSEVIGGQRSEIAAGAKQEIQDILNSYECGITITALQMQRVVPPSEVRPAFEDVISSIQEKQQLENEGEAQRNKLLPEARAEKDKLIQEARGYADRRRAEATGEIKALRAQATAYNKAPEVTRRRLYLEAMQEVLQAAGGKTILDDELKQILPLLPLNADGPQSSNISTQGAGR